MLHFLQIKHLDDIPMRSEEQKTGIIIAPDLLKNPLPQDYKKKLISFIEKSDVISLNFDDSFKDIRVRHNVHEDWFRTIPDMIKACTMLWFIDFSGITFTVEDLKASICELKKKGPSFFNISRSDIDTEKAKIIVDLITNSNHLSSISLANANLTDESVKIIAGALKGSTKLSDLNMSENGITSVGAKYLAEALEGKNRLKSIYLAHNNLTDKGMEAIVKALEKAKELEHLNFSKNNITVKGATILSKCLENKMEIQVLSIESNDIEDAGAEKIAIALKDKKALKTIEMSYNNLTEEGADKVFAILSDHNSLKKIQLYEENNTGEHQKIIGTGIIYIQKLDKFASLVANQAKNNLYANPADINSLKLNLLLSLIKNLDISMLNKLEKVSRDPQKYKDFIEKCAEPLKGNFEEIKHKDYFNHILQAIWKFCASLFFKVVDEGNNHRKGYTKIISDKVEDTGFVAKVQAEKNQIERVRG